MDTDLSPEDVNAVAGRLVARLPDIVDAETARSLVRDIEPLLEALSSATDEKERTNTAMDVIGVLCRHPTVRTQWGSAMYAYMTAKPWSSHLTALASALECSTESLEASFVLSSAVVPSGLTTRRTVVMEHGGRKAESIKWRHLLEPWKAGKLMANLIVNGVALVATPHPILVVAGVLLMLGDLREKMTLPLNEREATVLWGVLLASDDEGEAHESDVLNQTNRARIDAEFPALSASAALESLQRLEKLGVVRNRMDRESRKWKIVGSIDVLDT